MSVMNLPLVFRTVSAMLSSCRRKKASSTSSCPSAYVYDLGRLAAREGNEGQIGQAQTLRKRKWDTKLCTLSFHPIHTAATQTFVFIILNCSRLQAEFQIRSQVHLARYGSHLSVHYAPNSCLTHRCSQDTRSCFTCFRVFPHPVLPKWSLCSVRLCPGSLSPAEDQLQLHQEALASPSPLLPSPAPCR
ncbi:uncharacterized protein LOC104871008 isoform X2 [Fukomys damarensis]|uniref:uncharacterized protein LOC104871008 isoform X2 n=1 Tax=Fukomys damarensis TaxID=885580 RepID=UPI00054006FB|nr:uncharacterized protein LOC104871008 isoform X2 [Fukomys damarensis]